MNIKSIKIVALVFLAWSPATFATAAVKNWTDGTGGWNVGANWSGGTVPAGGDTVNIVFTDGVARTVTYDVNAPSLGLLSIDLTGDGTAATLSMPNNNNLTAAAIAVGGYNGSAFTNGGGAVIQSAGTTTISPGVDLILAWGPGSRGDYTLSGGTLVANQSEWVGLSGIGVFKHSAGTNTINANGVGDFFVGYDAAAIGTYILSGSGALVCNETGYSGIGDFFQVGGSNTISGAGNNLYLGYNAGSVGNYTLSGGTLSVGNDLVVGNSGTGTLTIENQGTVHVENNLSINAASTVNLNGGTLRFGGIGGLSRLNYIAGTIQLPGIQFFDDSIITTLFGANPTIPAGKGLNIEHSAFNVSSQTVRVSGGSLSAGVLLRVSSAELEITEGGIVTSAAGENEFGGRVTVSGPASAWTLSDYLRVGDSSELNIRDDAVVDTMFLNLWGSGVVNLDGGRVRFETYSRASTAAFNFNAGTIQLAGDRSIGTDAAVREFFGAAPTITTGKQLTVEGTATLLTTVTLDGGTFIAIALAGGNHLQLHRGRFHLVNQAVTIESGGLFGSALDVNDDMTISVRLGITNEGLVTGDGEIGGPFTNAAAGELRAQAGRSLRLTGSGNTNAGQIRLFGGELEFTQDLTNSAGAFISGNGSLIVGGGLVNQGTMNFAGTANIDGAVTNAIGGTIISGGGGATIFYDDVTNNGEIRTSTNGFTVFFGNVSGSGTFTGTGTVNFEGDLSPGSSPAAVNFAGDVVLGADSTLRIELGGASAGTQYDQINVAGDLTLGGTLEISLINGFTPTAGQTFDFLNGGTMAGAFSSVVLPDLPGLVWNTSHLAAGMLSVALPGDYNGNGIVDAADYTVWQDARGQTGTGLVADGSGNGVVDTADYNLWKANFGAPGAAAVGVASRAAQSLDGPTTAVPEPSAPCLILLLSAARLPARARRYR